MVASFRVIVEWLFALVKRYKIATQKCRLSVQKHVLALRIVYQLVNRVYKVHTLRILPEEFYTWVDSALGQAHQIFEEETEILPEIQAAESLTQLSE